MLPKQRIGVALCKSPGSYSLSPSFDSLQGSAEIGGVDPAPIELPAGAAACWWLAKVQ